MTDKIGDKDKKKISGVGSTTKASEIEKASEVTSVGEVKGATSVSGVKGVGAAIGARLTRAMSFEERETILRMVQEEAQKLVKEGALPPSKAGEVADAVKMAIDAGLLPKEKK